VVRGEQHGTLAALRNQLDGGRVLVSGTLAELLRDGSGSMRLRLRAPLPDALAADWRTRYALRADGAAEYQLRVPAAMAVAQVIEAAQAAGCEPIAIDYGRRDLEQLFMQLTNRSLRD